MALHGERHHGKEANDSRPTAHGRTGHDPARQGVGEAHHSAGMGRTAVHNGSGIPENPHGALAGIPANVIQRAGRLLGSGSKAPA